MFHKRIGRNVDVSLESTVDGFRYEAFVFGPGQKTKRVKNKLTGQQQTGTCLGATF